MAGKVTLVPAGQEPSEEERDADLAAFLQEVNKLIEMEPEKMTGAQHIDRLFRPGSKYFNMNPFEVLGLDWDADPDAVKKMSDNTTSALTSLQKAKILILKTVNQIPAMKSQKKCSGGRPERC